MTLCRLLAEKEKNGKTISAYEKYDKHSAMPYYQIVISQNAIALEVIKTAKTTWKRKYNEI